MKRLTTLCSAVMFALAMAACGQTDAGITTNIKTKFATDDLVKAHEINVTTQDHVVTLEGEVASTAVRARAVEIARTANGVRDVNDQLRVTAATTGDVDIDVDVDGKIEEGARETGQALKKGAEATADAAKRAGKAVRDAVTDSDRDSDRDGH